MRHRLASACVRLERVLQQVRHLGGVLEHFIVEVDVDDVLSHVGAIPSDRGQGDEVVGLERRHPRSNRRVLLPVAVAAMVVGLVGALWAVAGDRGKAPADQPTAAGPATTNVPALDVEAPATIPADNLAADAVFRVGVDTPVGRFEIYDQPDTQQTSLYLRTATSVVGGPFDNATIEAGFAWSLIGGAHESNRLAFGLAPNVDDYWVDIGGLRVEPNEHGIWYAVVDGNITEFTIHGPEGPATIEADPVPASSTTTVLETTEALLARACETSGAPIVVAAASDPYGGPNYEWLIASTRGAGPFSMPERIEALDSTGAIVATLNPSARG